jgi:hypothetical protein
LLFGISIWIYKRKRVCTYQLAPEDTSKDLETQYQTLNFGNSRSEEYLGGSQYQFENVRASDLSTKIYSAAKFGSLTMQNSFTILKESFNRSLDRSNSKSSTKPLLSPKPIEVKDYMAAVGSNWPSEDDKPYRPPPGSLIADGLEQYYKVAADGFAYPVDSSGWVIKPGIKSDVTTPIIVKCSNEDKIQLVSYPELHECCEPCSEFRSIDLKDGWVGQMH